MAEVKVTFKGIDALYTEIAAQRLNLDPITYIRLVLKRHFKENPIDPPEWLMLERDRNNRDLTSDPYEEALLESFTEYHRKLKDHWKCREGVGTSFRKD